MNRRRLIIGLLLAGAAVSAQEREGVGLYLFSIPSQTSAMLSGTGADAPFAELHVADPQAMAEHFAATVVEVVSHNDGVVTVAANTAGTVLGAPLPQHSKPSFVVDYDEESVGRVYEDLVARHGERPSIEAMTRYVFDVIPDKTYARDFDLASRVASEGEGDCTEHAVLLTALSRATGRPSRVVMGLQLVQEDDQFFTYGHAWSEIYDEGRWQLADATLPQLGMPEAVVRYLPLFALDNEGPGYAWDLAAMLRIYPSRVHLVRGGELHRNRE